MKYFVVSAMLMSLSADCSDMGTIKCEADGALSFSNISFENTTINFLNDEDAMLRLRGIFCGAKV